MSMSITVDDTEYRIHGLIVHQLKNAKNAAQIESAFESAAGHVAKQHRHKMYKLLEAGEFYYRPENTHNWRSYLVAMRISQMQVRDRLEIELANQKVEYERIYKLVTDGKSPMYDLDFVRGVICGLEISLDIESENVNE